MEASKLIVVLGDQNILRKSVETILATKPDWKVISTASLEELEQAGEVAARVHPELVFILEGCHDDRLALKLFMEYPTCKVIQISLEDNLMDVYSIQKIWFDRPADLLKVIEAEAQQR